MLLYIIIAIIVFDYLLNRWLEYLNNKTWNNKLPTSLNDLYNEDEYRKAMDYDHTNNRFSFLTDTFSTILTIALLLTAFFGKLNDFALSISADPIYSCLLFFGIIAIANDVITMPFTLYSTFVIEQKFGFNKTTLKIFFIDKIKGYLLGGLLGGCLLAMFVLFYQVTGSLFWLYAWVAFTIVTLFMTMFYASWILPLFNKLSPLPQGELRKAIESYCRKVDFKLDNLFVMDGSKRSSKANAFFSGLGSKKRIVLYDTLIEQHSTEELVAILAHEIGHYKLKHTKQFFVVSILQTGLTLFVLSLFVNTPSLSFALGSDQQTLQLNLLAFGILYSPVSMILGLLMNQLSRKNEYEADAFAAKTFAAKPLAEALKKLNVKQLSNLQPHPLYVFFHYSHPTLLQRLSNLKVI